jgi:hypothetical protein
MTEKPTLDPRLKLALDFGPLLLFFVVWWRFDIFVATGAFMVAVLTALIVSYAQTGRWPIMLVVTAGFVMVFGSLTLVLHDNTFIMVKPTIIYALFGSVLLAGYLLDKPFLAVVFDSVFRSPRKAGASSCCAGRCSSSPLPPSMKWSGTPSQRPSGSASRFSGSSRSRSCSRRYNTLS